MEEAGPGYQALMARIYGHAGKWHRNRVQVLSMKPEDQFKREGLKVKFAIMRE